MMPISWPESILLWPAQKIMCQKSATFSWSWLGLLIMRYTQSWVLTSNGARFVIRRVVAHQDVVIDAALRG